MKKKTIADVDVKGKRVLVRVDFNVPLSCKDPNEKILVTDETRMVAALPTIQYLLDHDAALIICSHLGRPSSGEDKQFAMDPVGISLGELLERPVKKLDVVVGSAARGEDTETSDIDLSLVVEGAIQRRLTSRLPPRRICALAFGNPLRGLGNRRTVTCNG